MKVFILVIALMVCGISGSAQTGNSAAESEKQRRDRENLVKTADLSPASRYLHERFLNSVTGEENEKILQDVLLVTAASYLT